MKNKLIYSFFFTFFIPFSAHAVDQCNNTAECRTKFGSTATDCKNSKSDNSICMCGAQACDTGTPSSTAVSSNPASSVAPSSVAPSSVAPSSVAASSAPASVAASSKVASSSGGTVSGARIAVTADGNANDRDDICATPMTIGLIYKAGKAKQVVHYTINDHVWSEHHNASWATEMHRSYDGAMALTNGQFTNVSKFDAYANKSAAVNDLVAEMNKSTATSPLTVIMAGRAEIVGSAIKIANKTALSHVTVISHSARNNTHGSEYHNGLSWSVVTGSPVTVKQIKNQNGATGSSDGLSKPHSQYTGLRDSSDKLAKFIWDRCQVAKKDVFDPSDAGMAYYYLNNGDQNATPSKLVNAITK